jgi:hypothetical protein
MSQRSRTDPCGGCRATGIPTATGFPGLRPPMCQNQSRDSDGAGSSLIRENSRSQQSPKRKRGVSAAGSTANPPFIRNVPAVRGLLWRVEPGEFGAT